MRSPRSSSSVSLFAPVRRVGVGGALLGWGTGRVLLERITGLESLLAEERSAHSSIPSRAQAPALSAGAPAQHPPLQQTSEMLSIATGTLHF